VSGRDDGSAPERPAADPALVETARALARTGRRLEREGDGGIDTALTAVADARAALEHIESQLVSVALAHGRSWAQIGANLNIIIPRDPDAQLQAAARYARRRRSANGTSQHVNGSGQR
jgi:hypothetical protein